MNSSLQILYMNPILRQIIYDLPLCESDDITKPSNFIELNQKYEILMAIQKLFCELQYLNTQAISTIKLTEAFKWHSSEGSNQQDSQEFIRLFLYEILERILIGTAYDGHINNLFKILTTVSLKCGNCAHTKNREEANLDICLPVKDNDGVLNSLNQLFKHEEVIMDYKCEACEEKVDLIKSSKINHLPLFLNFPLNKFEFDFETFERIKLNDKYQFPLEIDMNDYVTDGFVGNCEDTKYELYGIIIHRGTPYSGHYFSYIRDLNKEGKWDLQEIKEFLKEPVKAEEKKEEEENPKTDATGDTEEKNALKNGNENQRGKGKKGANNNNNKNYNQKGNNHNVNKNQNKGKKKSMINESFMFII